MGNVNKFKSVALLNVWQYTNVGLNVYKCESVWEVCVYYRRQVQRHLALLVLRGGVGSVGQEQSAELRAALLRSLVEGCEGPFISGIYTGVKLDQQGRDVHMLEGKTEAYYW